MAPKLLPQVGMSVMGLMPVGLPGFALHPLSRAARSRSPSTASEVLPGWRSPRWAIHHFLVKAAVGQGRPCYWEDTARRWGRCAYYLRDDGRVG